MMDVDVCKATHTPGIRLCNYLCLSILCDVLRQQQSAPMWSSRCKVLPLYFSWKGRRPCRMTWCYVFGVILQNLCGKALWKRENGLVASS